MQCLHNERARLIIGTACLGTHRAARIREAVTRPRACRIAHRKRGALAFVWAQDP